MPSQRRTISMEMELLDALGDEAREQDRTLSSLLSSYGRQGLDRDPVRRERERERKRGRA